MRATSQQRKTPRPNRIWGQSPEATSRKGERSQQAQQDVRAKRKGARPEGRTNPTSPTGSKAKLQEELTRGKEKPNKPNRRQGQSARAADQRRGRTQDAQPNVMAKRTSTQPEETENPTSQRHKRGRTQEPEKDVRAKREATSQKAIQRRGRTQHPQQDAKPIHLFLLRSPGKCFRFLSPCFSLFRDLEIRASNRACDLKFLRRPC